MADSILPAVKELRRFRSPVITPQALAWDGAHLLMSSRDLGTLIKVELDSWRVIEEIDPPGIVWAASRNNDGWWFTIGKGLNDDRYVYRFTRGEGFTKLFSCPDLTGSYLSFDGESHYLSQWYKHRILKMDENGRILRQISVGAEISGHTFVDGAIYVLRGAETPNEEWRIARLDPDEETPNVQDLGSLPFACRSLTFDGKTFWSNYRAAGETISFALPG